MTKIFEIYKCEICGNIVEVLHEAGGTLVCCGQPMKLLSENTTDASIEKHVPVIEVIEGDKERVKIKVGSVAHPMIPEHYIEFIEATSESGNICKVFLKPGQKPEAEFIFEVKQARAYCNLHGLWKSA